MSTLPLLSQSSVDFDALAKSIGQFEQCPLRTQLYNADTLSDLSDLSDLPEEDDAHPEAPDNDFAESSAQLPPARRTRSLDPSKVQGSKTKVQASVRASSPNRVQVRQSKANTRAQTIPAPVLPTISPQPPRKTKPLPSRPPSNQPRVVPTTAPLSLPLPRQTPAFQFTPIDGLVSPPPRKKARHSKARKKPATDEELAKLKAKKNASRKRKRKSQSRFRGLKDVWIKHMREARIYVLQSFDITDTPHGLGGWRGSSSNVYEAPRTLSQALSEGFEEFQWDGSFTVVFLDCNRRFIMMLRKKDMSEEGLARQARMTATLKREAERALLSRKFGQGNFHALRDGLVHNQGTHVPSQVANNQTNTRVLRRILEDEDFVFESRQTDIALRMWHPAQHQAMWDVKEALSNQPETEHLVWPFEHSAYALTTINFGPQTCCKTHRDNGDFAFLMSVLKAFGPYDYTRGGHIVLPTLRLAIQFPQGAEAYFPTAQLPHANTLIAPHETRYSVTSYSGGGLYEWVYCGGLSKAGWMRYLEKHEKKEEEALMDESRPALFTDRFFPVWL